MISRKSLQTFKKLYEARFKEKLDDQEALQKANRILNLYRLLYGPKSYGLINPKAPNNQTNQN